MDLEPSADYCGGTRYFSEGDEAAFSVIPERDLKSLLDLGNGHDVSEIPKSLIMSIVEFVVLHSAMKASDGIVEKHKMMVHVITYVQAV